MKILETTGEKLRLPIHLFRGYIVTIDSSRLGRFKWRPREDRLRLHLELTRVLEILGQRIGKAGGCIDVIIRGRRVVRDSSVRIG